MSLPGRASPAIADLRGLDVASTPAASAVDTPRVDDADTVEEGEPVRSLAPLTPGTDEAARFPLTTRGTYEVAGKFAQGGIGRILRAHDPVLGRTVALKELLIAGHRTDEERFVREVLLTARLQHPGIVPVYAAGRWPSPRGVLTRQHPPGDHQRRLHPARMEPGRSDIPRVPRPHRRGLARELHRREQRGPRARPAHRRADGVRAWVAAHHDPEAATPVTRTGCLMPASDLSSGTGSTP